MGVYGSPSMTGDLTPFNITLTHSIEQYLQRITNSHISHPECDTSVEFFAV